MAKNKQTVFARQLRFNQTEAEKLLWYKLRSIQIDGLKFRRQQPIGDYVVDFISFGKKLIIEVDGGQHNEERTIKFDEKRRAWLEGQGFHLIRFWNNDVLLNIDGVVSVIIDTLK